MASGYDPRYEKAFEPEESSRQRFVRKTRGGRTIHYDLSVLQQPERARACGSGPKSSADRRPVDPPPIVRLSVYEGEDPKTAKDITFDYPAEFFLYVSLENARPMSHGRVQTPAATSPPVLTGMPCSSCVYLDRPQPAGYFLFPDLSVRHEGMYKFIFRLYEQNKDELDLNTSVDERMNTMSCPTQDGTHFFTHVMSIYSQPFQVFSAKKFPGLAESTTLSRTVAEQGCRVRIRRDVRMRRREAKGGSGADKAEDYSRQQPRAQSPDPYRARSSSNSSLDRTGFPRRPSEYGPPPLAAAPGGILDFRSSNRYQPPSEPSSPATSFHHRGSIAYPPPTPTSAVHPPFPPRRPSSTDDRRSSYSYPSFSVSHSRPSPRLSLVSLPPIDAGLKSLQVDLSPVSSHSASLSQGSDSHYLPIQPKKRSFDQSIRPDKDALTLWYRRSGGAPISAKPVDANASYHSTYLDPRLRSGHIENIKTEAEETGPRKRQLRA